MQTSDLAVAELELDPRNPRLPEELLDAPESALLRWLDDEAVLNELAASMVENGFFAHEPLIVRRDLSVRGKRTVVEGNRRFAALSILLQLPSAIEAERRFDFAVPPTPEQLDRLRIIPCVLVDDPEEVRKFLGFRHIGGIRTWSPEAKARYLDEEVRRALLGGSENVFRDVARLVGSNVPGVRGPYVALHILRAAREVYGIDSNFVMRKRFGVWNRMMNSSDLRAYINFGEAVSAEDVHRQVQLMDKDNLAEVLGDLQPAAGQRSAVLNDSRDVTAYAAVLQNPRAHETLRVYRDLSLAKQIIERASMEQKIRKLAKSVELMMRDIDDADISEDVVDASRTLLSQARTLHAGIKARADSDDDD